MKSQEVMELMNRYLDGDLDDRERQKLERHLAQSPEAAALFERLQRLHHDLEQLPQVTPPASIVDAILPKLEQAGAMADEETQARRAVSRTERRARYRLNWAGGAALAAVLLLAVVLPSGLDLLRTPVTNQAEQLAGAPAAMGMATMMSDGKGRAAQVQVSAAFGSTADASVPESGTASGAGASGTGRTPRETAELPPPDAAPQQGKAEASRAVGIEAPAVSGTENQAFSMNVIDQYGMVVGEFAGGRAPDGWLVALEPAEEGTRVIVIDDAGETVHVSAAYPGEAGAFRWSEDGSALMFVVEHDGETRRVTIDIRQRTERAVPVSP